MMKRIITSVCLAALLATGGCSSIGNNEVAVIEAPLSTSSANHQYFSLEEFNALVFEPVVPGKDDALLADRPAVYRKLESLMQDHLQSRLSVPADGNHDSPLLVRFGIASDDTVSDAQLIAFFGSTPGLNIEPEEKKLTIAITLIRQNSNEVIWKGAAQGTALPALPRELQLIRAEQAVAALLDSI